MAKKFQLNRDYVSVCAKGFEGKTCHTGDWITRDFVVDDIHRNVIYHKHHAITAHVELVVHAKQQIKIVTHTVSVADVPAMRWLNFR